MRPGDVYWTDVPFRSGDGSKTRSFLVLHVIGTSVIGIEGTGQERDDLTLLLHVDRARPEFRATGVSSGYYYCEGARELRAAQVAAGEQRGRLSGKQLQRVERELNSWLIRRNPPPGLAH